MTKTMRIIILFNFLVTFTVVIGLYTTMTQELLIGLPIAIVGGLFWDKIIDGLGRLFKKRKPGMYEVTATGDKDNPIKLKRITEDDQ